MPVQLLDPFPGPFQQLVDRTELNRLRGAGLGARGHQAVTLAVEAERALVRMSVERAAGDDAERARRDTVGAAVADVRLDVDVPELVVDDGPGGARLLTGRRHAVLAHVAHHEPASGIGAAPVGELLDELHVAPRRGRQLAGVVVAVAGPREAVRRELVPLLARDLACLAAD